MAAASGCAPARCRAAETLASVSEKGTEAEIDSLVSKAGAELRAKLGVSALSDAQSASVRASLPSNPEAARLYSQGLQKLRMLDVLTARDLLEKAAALAPDHAPTHSALAASWAALGYDSKAKEQAKLALDLSPRFSREERLLIEGRAHELLSEPSQAVASYRSLWESFPDNIVRSISDSRPGRRRARERSREDARRSSQAHRLRRGWRPH